MSRYIDADALKESLMKTLHYAKAWKKESKRVGNSEIQIFAERAIVDFTECILRVNNQPTLDAVEVIRCKYCKWWDFKRSICNNYFFSCSVNDFCSHAERK